MRKLNLSGDGAKQVVGHNSLATRSVQKFADTDRGQVLREAWRELQGRVVHEESRLGEWKFDPPKMPGRNVLRDSLLQFQVTQMGMKVIPTQSDP